MAVTLYIFDPLKRVRKILVGGVTMLIHKEWEHSLTAEIPVSAGARPGEYLGFTCVDGRFRLFAIDTAEIDDDQGTIECTAMDAAVAEMLNTVIVDKTKEDATAKQTAEMLLQGTGWALGRVTESTTKNTVSAYYTSLWEALMGMQDLYKVRILPYYSIDKGQIANRTVDVIDKAPTYRGRMFEQSKDASGVFVTYSNEPATVLYGVGDEAGTEENTRVTLASIAWSKSKGDPVDKPLGQAWMADPDAVAKYGRRERVFAAADIKDAKSLAQATWDELQRIKEPAVNVAAKVTDMEMQEGMSYKMVRMDDEVIVRTRHAGDIRAVIIKIERDYVRPDLTKLEIGSEIESLTSRVATLTRSAIRTNQTITLYRNKFHHDEALIQLNANAIQLNAKDILESAERIRLHGTRLDQNEESIITAELEIDGLKSEIKLKADAITLEGYVTIDAFEARVAQIERLVSGLGTIGTLLVNNLQAGNVGITGSLNVNGVSCSVQSLEVLTSAGGRGVTGEYKTIQYKNWSGENASTSVMTGFTQAAMSTEKKTIRFVGAPVV